MRIVKYIMKYMMFVFVVVIQIIIFFKIWQHYEVNTYFRHINKAWAIIIFYSFTSIIFMWFFGVTDTGHKRLLDILSGNIMAAGLTNVLAYLQLCMLQDYPYLYSIKVIGLIIIINYLVSSCIFAIFQYIYIKMTPIQDAVIITSHTDMFSDIISQGKRNDKLVGIKNNILLKNNKEYKIDDILNQIKRYKVIIIGDIPSKIRNDILKYCYEHDKKCYSVAKTSDILIKSAKMSQLGYRPVTLHNIKSMLPWQSALKRITDIVLSSLGIIVLLPVFILITCIIRCTDGYPAIFKQDRYTKNGKIFKIYKFRSMYYNNGDEDLMASKYDKRITPVGKILRRTHMDEIPQLFNVLKGDMSIVGPRPEMVSMVDKYCMDYPEYRYRTKVKAGITGYAQVYGKYSTSPEDKLRFDMIYICNYSMFLDLKLILLTFKIFMAKDSSEGTER